MKKLSVLAIIALAMTLLGVPGARAAAPDNSELEVTLAMTDNDTGVITVAGRITSSTKACRNNRLIKSQRKVGDTWKTVSTEPVTDAVFGVQFPAGSIGTVRMLLTSKRLPSGKVCAFDIFGGTFDTMNQAPVGVSDVTNTSWVHRSFYPFYGDKLLFVGYLDSIPRCVVGRTVLIRRKIDNNWRVEGKDVVTSKSGVVALRAELQAGAQLIILRRKLKDGTICDSLTSYIV